MQNRFDVLIIGAGPAGLQCARALGPSGTSVLVLERRTEIGPKPCGGGLTFQDERFGIPEAITRSSPEQTIRVGTHETIIHLKHPLRSITRLDLGQFLLSEVQRFPNITVKTDCAVTDVTRDAVVTAEGTFAYTSLVGADGADSMVRRFLKLPKRITLGITADVPVASSRVLWHFDPKRIKTAYLWSFPKSENRMNIGAYFDPEELPYEQAVAALRDFASAEGFPFREEDLKGSPLGVLYEGFHFGNVFLAGDAAGLTEALTGEGIAFALTSGDEVARTILNPAYDAPELTRMLRIKHHREKMLAFLRAHPRIQTAILRAGALMMKTARFQRAFGN